MVFVLYCQCKLQQLYFEVKTDLNASKVAHDVNVVPKNFFIKK